MRVTIIKNDHTVYVDGVPLGVNCDTLASDVHAMQWYDTWGEVEYIDNIRPPMRIDNLNAFMHLIDKHAETKAKLEEALRKASKIETGPGGMRVIAGD